MLPMLWIVSVASEPKLASQVSPKPSRVAVSPMLFVFSSGTYQNIGIIELPLNTFQLWRWVNSRVSIVWMQSVNIFLETYGIRIRSPQFNTFLFALRKVAKLRLRNNMACCQTYEICVKIGKGWSFRSSRQKFRELWQIASMVVVNEVTCLDWFRHRSVGTDLVPFLAHQRLRLGVGIPRHQ